MHEERTVRQNANAKITVTIGGLEFELLKTTDHVKRDGISADIRSSGYL